MANIDNETTQALEEILKDKSVFRRNLRLRELVNAKKELDDRRSKRIANG